MGFIYLLPQRQQKGIPRGLDATGEPRQARPWPRLGSFAAAPANAG